MNFIERVMRVMTHVNIGAALGLAAWIMWSGWQVVTGQIAPAYRVAEVQALMSLEDATEPVPMRLLPVQAGTGALPPCHTAASAPKPSAVALTGADL